MKRVLLILASFLAVLPLRAQDYDAALDRFAAITNDCLRLKARLHAGEALSAQALEGILDELRSLQQDLQLASGSMSPAQKDRYKAILQCYRDNRMVPESALSTTDPPPGNAVQEKGSRQKQVQERPDQEVPPFDLARLRNKTFLLATASFPLEGGLTAGHVRGRWGGFLHASGNGFYPSGTIDALSDGSSGEGFIWTSGAARTGRFSATAGVIWLPNPYRYTPVGLYAGAGYGFSRLHWQTTDNTWARITDRSATGPDLECGVLLFHRHLALSAGVSTLAFRTVSFTAGLGIRF